MADRVGHGQRELAAAASPPVRPVLLVVWLVLGAAAPAPGQEPRTVAITSVTVINPADSAAPLTNQTILIQDGMIRSIGPTLGTEVPRGARRIDGRGKFAMPGLWDSHVHFMNTGPGALALFLAHGVTTVREMGGYLDSTLAWRARMQAGALAGPRIITPGPLLESPRYLQGVRERSARPGQEQLALRVLPYRVGVGNAEEARVAIDSLTGLGVDFVKFRTVATPEAYYAILREAKRAGLRVAGHPPAVASLQAALDSGQADIEHAFFPLLSAGAPERRDSVIARFVRYGAWYTPTLVVSRAVTLSGDSAYRLLFGERQEQVDERRRYASDWLLGWWRTQVEERRADTSTARARLIQQAYESSLEDVRRMRAAGVRLLAGTDAGSVLIYPGFSLHEELELLVTAGGLSPREALRAATIEPARFARLDDRLGAIASGRIADLVLLDADPLADIRNTRRIAAVVQAGRVLTRPELERLLESAKGP